MPKVRQEVFDIDYINQLNPEQKEFMAKFVSEYYGAAISKEVRVIKNKKGRKGYTSKRVKSGHLHKTNALAKDCMDANNRRNNDLLGVAKANGLIGNIIDENDEWYKDRNLGLSEEAMIAFLDDKYKKEA